MRCLCVEKLNVLKKTQKEEPGQDAILFTMGWRGDDSL